MAAIADDATLIAFVYHEARLIDEQRFDEWHRLFAEDARYWIPLTRGQRSPLTENSLMYEDRLLLELRIARLRNPHAYSQALPSRCQHVLQAPHVDERGDSSGVALLRTPFVYFESRGDAQAMFTAVAWHHLVRAGDGLKMRLKKVELLNAEAALGSLQLFP